MKRFIAAGLIFGAMAGALLARSLVHAGAPATLRPYHQESSTRVVHTTHGYRIVPSTTQSRHEQGNNHRGQGSVFQRPW
jgi:hypothetical protein